MREFDKEKEIKKINNHNKKLIIRAISFVFLLCAITIFISTSFAFFKTSEELLIMDTKVGQLRVYTSDDITIKYYLDNIEKTSMPNGIYTSHNCTEDVILNFNTSNNEITFSNIKAEAICKIYFKTPEAKTFAYTGTSQSYTVTLSGTYKIELWGSEGGSIYTNSGAKGAYTKGEISLNKGEVLYFYVGQRGINAVAGGAGGSATFNGGGAGGYGAFGGGSGGGASDVRFGGTGYLNRIMVAAGAGGGIGYSGAVGEPAAGLTGSGITIVCDGQALSVGAATQTSGGANGIGLNGRNYTGGAASCGGEGNGGGGGGYYGGLAGQASGYWTNNAGGAGTSFISGHSGCNARNAGGTHTGNANHFSGKVFTNTLMIDGAGYRWTTAKTSLYAMPTVSGGTYASGTGHSGNGAAKITFIR